MQGLPRATIQPKASNLRRQPKWLPISSSVLMSIGAGGTRPSNTLLSTWCTSTGWKWYFKNPPLRGSWRVSLGGTVLVQPSLSWLASQELSNVYIQVHLGWKLVGFAVCSSGHSDILLRALAFPSFTLLCQAKTQQELVHELCASARGCL